MNYNDPQKQTQLNKNAGKDLPGAAAWGGEDLLLSILNASLDIIQAFDAVRDDRGIIVDFRWKLQNERGRQQNGDVIGMSLLSLNPGVVPSGIFGRMVQVVETGISSEQEQHYYHEQFSDQWFYQALVKQGDGVIMTTRDITAQKKAHLETQAARNRLEAVINVSAIALAKLVAVRDKEGAIVDFIYEWLNDAAVQIGFGATGKSMLQSFPYTSAGGLFKLMVKAVETGQMQQTEFHYVSGEHDLWLYYKIARLDDGIMFSCDNVTERKQAEQALQEQAHLIQAVTDVMPDIVSVVSLPSREIIYTNRNTLPALGVDEEGITNLYTQHSRLLHPEDLPAVEAYYQRFGGLQDDEENKLECRIKKNSGEWILLSVRGKIFKRDSAGNITQILMISQDITERRKNEQEVLELKDQIARKAEEQLKQSESLLASVFKALPIGLGFFNTSGEAVLLNDEMRRFLPDGAMPSRDEESARRWVAYHPDGSRISRSDYPGARALKGDPILPFLEMQYLQDDGSRIWARVSSIPFSNENGATLGFISVITDIDELKESEQQLKLLLKQKDEFISIASHELKTPVTSIKAYSQLVQANLERAGDFKNSDLLARLNAQIDRLINLINQLLDLTRVQEGKLELQVEATDINELLHERIEEIRPTTSSYFILHTAELPLIKVDRERIGQVITNLLSNAIKYSSPDSQITVSSGIQADGVRISVQDRGKGISEQDQQKVFERFFRTTDGHTHLAPGMGLGLYISAQIVRRHGGYFTLESKKGEGSVFSFLLPY